MSLSSEVAGSTTLADRIGRLTSLIAARVSEALTSTPRRTPAPVTTPGNRIDRLIESGGWTDAALALIATDLPQWQLRRLVYDGGEWHCALSPAGEMPDWLDEPIETHHTDLARALLTAYAAARQLAPLPDAVPPRDFTETLPCDNFG
jgi:hypothetical protein